MHGKLKFEPTSTEQRLIGLRMLVCNAATQLDELAALVRDPRKDRVRQALTCAAACKMAHDALEVYQADIEALAAKVSA